MAQLENIEAIERRLWGAPDTLRSNSNYASNEYFLPVMGLIFLRHAYNRFQSVRDEIVATLPSRGGKTRELTKEDFSKRTAIYLRPEAQFDYIVNLTDSDDRAQAIISAMESIEEDYESLRGVLPKAEYQELDNEVLGRLLRTLNPEELKRASGDIFGRIYEYFLTQFAGQKAHDGGEFFTPVSIVSLIANVLEPGRGLVLDPACGSGGMFVQSAHFVERLNANPSDRLAFYGLEKNPTTIRLAKMNLAVHGLEGDIQKAITYYEDPHELLGRADFVMANPPFNVDDVDGEKAKRDPRLPFGLPGISKGTKANPERKGKVSNGNYLWISYFFSYLKETGRAGFVMSSQASSAGGDEAKVRRRLVESGAVDIMIAIRPNFFYTRTVPCELWFLNKDKPEEHRDKVLMLDARSIYRKLTRTICDFSPEQVQNLLAIVWLYRGQGDRVADLLASYLKQTLHECRRCFEDGKEGPPLGQLTLAASTLLAAIQPFLQTQNADSACTEPLRQLQEAVDTFVGDAELLQQALLEAESQRIDAGSGAEGLRDAANRIAPIADIARNLVKQVEQLYKLATRLLDCCENELDARSSGVWVSRQITRLRKTADDARRFALEQLKRVRYFHKQARWLLDRFPDGELRDVSGLVKLVDRAEIETSDWSLTPGRYVGVAPEEEDEDFDFEEALRDIHLELEGLNAEAAELAARIARNIDGLGV